MQELFALFFAFLHMQLNLSQNMATLLHLALVGLQVIVVAFIPSWTIDQRAAVVGFIGACQGVLGYRAFDLTPGGTPVPNPPSKPVVEAREEQLKRP